MPVINGEELVFKIVYWGPVLVGKTSNLRHLHASAEADTRGQLISLHTDGGSVLLLDRFASPLVGHIEGRRGSLQFHALVGSIGHSEEAQRALLRGLDGLVFVADSQEARRESNQLSLEILRERLGQLGMTLDAVPHVFQYNKRDLPEIAPVEVLRADLNPHGAPEIEAVATRGEGVVDTFRALLRILGPRISGALPPANP